MLEKPLISDSQPLRVTPSQELIQPERWQVKTLIECKDAYNMQILHISLVKNHVAEWSSSKIDQGESSRVLRFYIVCWSLASNNRAIENWRMYGTNTDLWKRIWQPEKCNSVGTNYQMLPFLTSRRIFGDAWTAKFQNLLMRRSYSCLCSSVTLPPIFPATEPWSLGQLRKKRRKLPLPRYTRQQEGSHPYHVGKQFTLYLQSNLPVGMRLKICYLHREERNTKSKLNSTPSTWHWFRTNNWKCHKLEASRCYNSQTIAKHWLIRRASRCK